jgi:hypothetical protein
VSDEDGGVTALLLLWRRFVVVVVGLLMLWFLSCFGVKTGFANYWLELLLQVLR